MKHNILNLAAIFVLDYMNFCAEKLVKLIEKLKIMQTLIWMIPFVKNPVVLHIKCLWHARLSTLPRFEPLY